MAISSEEFRAALGRFASGVTVVTTRDSSGAPHGITVSAFSSLSMNPPLVLICISKTADSHQALVESGRFTVNILSADQSGVSDQFAFRQEDRFKGIEFRLGEQGIPIIEGCLANLECRVVNEYGGGDHTIFVGEIEAIHTGDNSPLIYWSGEYRTIA